MADLKISQFVDGGAVLPTDEIATNRAGVNTKVFVGTAASKDTGTDPDQIPTNADIDQYLQDNGYVQLIEDSSGISFYPSGDGSLIEGALVRVSPDDAQAGNLEDKITAGSNVTVTKLSDSSGIETIEISSTGGGGGGIPEAPNDGDGYVRQSENWSVVGSAAFENVGEDVGDVVQLEDVGGNPGLPAVDGSQLLNIPGGVTVTEFTSSGTWNKPLSGTIAEVYLLGGGGSGGAGASGSDSNCAGGGGGGGGNKLTLFLSDLPSTVAVTIGTGGSASGVTRQGNPGTVTSFGTYGSAYGGGGGSSGASGGQGGGGGGGGIFADGASASTAAGSVGGAGGAGGGGAGGGQSNVVATPGGIPVGGGGGGFGDNADAISRNGGGAMIGGGGGGGASNSGSQSPAGSLGGISSVGGNGGRGANANTSVQATDGIKGGGGGGGAGSSFPPGSGGNGYCLVIVY